MMDLALEAWVSSGIEAKKLAWMLGRGKRWQPGEKLKLLFAGYNGTRNTGSDVRVEEMLRQIRHILGADKTDFTMMTFDFERSRAAISRARIRFICRMCFRLFSIKKFPSIMAWWRARARCSRASLPMPWPP